MAKFTYKTLTVHVSEMSRATALDFAKECELIRLVADPEFLAREVDYLITRFAPSKVLYDGGLLDDGIHEIPISDDESITLVLPLTRENFNQLPVGLAAQWTKAAEAENQYVTDFFLQSLQKLVTNGSAKAPADGQ